MGNLYAESGLIYGRVENDFTPTYTISADYTTKLRNGQVTREQFRNNTAPPQTPGYGPGYGLAQWTYYTRKYNYYDYADAGNHGDFGSNTFELWFLEWEIVNDYPSVLSAMQNATNVRSASDVVLAQFENPTEQSEAVKILRASYGQNLYDEYHGTPPPPPPPTTIPVWEMFLLLKKDPHHAIIKPKNNTGKKVIF